MKEAVEVAYDAEFDEVLARLGLKDDLIAGALGCHSCGVRLDPASVSGVSSDGQKLVLFCIKPDCAAHLAQKSKIKL